MDFCAMCWCERVERPRIQDHLRVSIGTDEEMEAMCRAMEEILKGQ